MNWKKKVFVCCVAVLCTSAMLALSTDVRAPEAGKKIQLPAESKVTSAGLKGFGSGSQSDGSRGTTCPPTALFGQDVHLGADVWSAGTSDASFAENYKVYENFSGVSGNIQQVHFWGLSLNYNSGWFDCTTENPMDFLIEFWDDVAGAPGTVQYSEVISAAGTASGEAYSGFPGNEWTAVLSTPVALSAGWVSIQGATVTGPPDCVFLWMSGYGADGDSLQWDGTTMTATGYDRGLCLEGEYVPVDGACCNEYDGTCDYVEQLLCPAGSTFYPNLQCGDIDCGILGACCDAGLNCLFTAPTADTEAECDILGGTFYAGEDCATFACPDTCTHSVELMDSYGDGWNGCMLDVLVNGGLVLDDITVASGYGPEIFTFDAATGDIITTVFTAGSYASETSYIIKDVNGVELCNDGMGGTEPVGVTCTGNCGAAATGACCMGDGTCTVGTMAECTGTYMGDGTDCTVSCLGACCEPDGSCTDTAEDGCAFVFQGIGTDCATTTCPVTAENDDCSGAIAIGEVVDMPFDTTGATTDGIGTHSIGQDIWYCYTASCSGVVTVDLCDSSFDTKLAIWEGCECPPTLELAYNDDGCYTDALQSNVEFTAVAGESYLIQIGGYSTNEGPGDLTITCPALTGACCRNYNEYCDDGVTYEDCDGVNDTYFAGQSCSEVVCPTPPPPNDTCATATPIACGDVLTGQYNTDATDDYDPAVAGCTGYSAAGPDTVYVWTADGVYDVFIEMTNETGFDASLYVVTDCADIDNTCIAGGDDPEEASFTSVNGTTYYIITDSYGSSSTGGTFDLSMTCESLVATGACCTATGCEITEEALCTGCYLGDDTDCGAAGAESVTDGGFEAGVGGGAWTEASTNYGTPLCDVAGCGVGGGTGPYAGDYWCWFGGFEGGLEEGSIEQTLTIPVGSNTLEFYLEIPVASGNGTDFMNVLIDGNILFTVLENATGYETYVLVSLDISAYADGGSHLLRLEGTTNTATGVTNFFVDDISIAGAAVDPCICGDLDYDCDVDYDDYVIFLAGFGTIYDLEDYQEWLSCYRVFTDNPFAGPPTDPRLGEIPFNPRRTVRPQTKVEIGSGSGSSPFVGSQDPR